jgi:DNA-3-methyladenine glycosylase
LDAKQPEQIVLAENDILDLPRLTSELCSVRALELAPRLLGMILARWTPEGLTAGRIIEVEAYEGPEDRACHAFGGRRTNRNEVMYGPPGRAYVYFTYGMHWMLNVVAAPEGIAHAVLIRSIEPVCGTQLMAKRRRGMMPLAEGPARLCQALAITGADNGTGLTEGFRGTRGAMPASAGEDDREIFIAKPPEGLHQPPPYLVTKRVGVGNSGEAKHYPWRFVVKGTGPAGMKVDYQD